MAGAGALAGSSLRYTIVRDDWGAACAGRWFAGLQACLLPPPLPPSPPPAPAQPPVTAAPQQPVHLDDPKSCIDVPSNADNAAHEAAEAAEPAVEGELQRRIERRWPQTRTSLGGSPVTEPVHLEIEIGPDGNSRARSERPEAFGPNLEGTTRMSESNDWHVWTPRQPLASRGHPPDDAREPPLYRARAERRQCVSSLRFRFISSIVDRTDAANPDKRRMETMNSVFPST
jgi:hypothetical protein